MSPRPPLVFVCLACLLTGVAAGPPTEPPSADLTRKADIAKHVKELSSATFRLRAAASERLLAIGLEALSGLEGGDPKYRPGGLSTFLAHYRPVGVRREGAGAAVFS